MTIGFPRTGTNSLTTLPGVFPVAVTETLWPYAVDVTKYLAPSDTISGVTSTIVLVSTGQVLSSSWQNFINIQGNIIIVNVNISKLQLGQTYQILTNFTASTTKHPTYSSIIQVIA